MSVLFRLPLGCDKPARGSAYDDAESLRISSDSTLGTKDTDPAVMEEASERDLQVRL